MKFILTPELGRLAKWLRILGFDTVYVTKTNVSMLLIQALRDKRIILTRNERIINKLRPIRLVRIKSDGVKHQLKQIFADLKIRVEKDTMFSRCTICNAELNIINKTQLKDKVPAYVFKTQQSFFKCPCCQRIYWSGTHWGNVNKILIEINQGVN